MKYVLFLKDLKLAVTSVGHDIFDMLFVRTMLLVESHNNKVIFGKLWKNSQ